MRTSMTTPMMVGRSQLRPAPRTRPLRGGGWSPRRLRRQSSSDQPRGLGGMGGSVGTATSMRRRRTARTATEGQNSEGCRSPGAPAASRLDPCGSADSAGSDESSRRTRPRSRGRARDRHLGATRSGSNDRTFSIRAARWSAFGDSSSPGSGRLDGAGPSTRATSTQLAPLLVFVTCALNRQCRPRAVCPATRTTSPAASPFQYSWRTNRCSERASAALPADTDRRGVRPSAGRARGRTVTAGVVVARAGVGNTGLPEPPEALPSMDLYPTRRVCPNPGC